MCALFFCQFHNVELDAEKKYADTRHGQCRPQEW